MAHNKKTKNQNEDTALKGTAIAPSNIALSKYWGKRDDELTLPLNDSISMTLSGVKTITTVEFSNKYQDDTVAIGDSSTPISQVNGSKKERVVKQLDRLREIKGVNLPAKVVSKNNFPMGTGIASSASAFSALTAACLKALNLEVSLKEQSVLTRLAGSGSASRSVFGGFVLWHTADSSEESYAEQLYSQDYWDLSDIILVVSDEEKKHSSLFGHSLIKTSPFFNARLESVQETNQQLLAALENKDFKALGEALEREMFVFHSTAMTSQPSLLYWSPKTIEVLKQVRRLRQDGVEVYATLDAGPNVHLIAPAEQVQKLVSHFKNLEVADKIYHCRIGEGVRYTNQHLF